MARGYLNYGPNTQAPAARLFVKSQETKLPRALRSIQRRGNLLGRFTVQNKGNNLVRLASSLDQKG